MSCSTTSPDLVRHLKYKIGSECCEDVHFPTKGQSLVTAEDENFLSLKVEKEKPICQESVPS